MSLCEDKLTVDFDDFFCQRQKGHKGRHRNTGQASGKKYVIKWS
jgi:hypothetical protein